MIVIAVECRFYEIVIASMKEIMLCCVFKLNKIYHFFIVVFRSLSTNYYYPLHSI